MTRRVFTVPAEAYGVRVEVRVEYADNATRQELDRALHLAVDAARAAWDRDREGP